MDESMEYENIIFSLSMLLPGKYDYTKEDFLTPLLTGRFTVPTVFTPVYPYYEDVVAPIDACDEICKTMPQGYQLYIKSKLYEFFFVLDNRCRNLTKPLKSKKTLDKMKVVLKYVENNYADKISIQSILGIILWPVAWLIGAPSSDAQIVASLIGEKLVLNEFVAYSDLLNHMTVGDKAAVLQELTQKGKLIATFALCGFANFSSIGINVGCIGGLAPSRQSELAKLGIRAMFGGAMASMMTACLAGILM